MRKLLILTTLIFSLMFSSTSFAEKFICSYLYKKEPRSFTLDRKSNQLFEENSIGGSNNLKVLFEDEKYLILGMIGRFDGYDAYAVTFIDKNLKHFQTSAISEPKYKEKGFEVISGDCLIH